ncbi:13755_t:CDS:2 [Cetraspora pellucida]|uniref:13755_t:CDS:1 n=1 Tax=Cetraspora pellucida TaxID=1433469 RepID=A0ACA9JY12_9GLOM|nr:13755_t:CDS:2 [Cetraspora pellucida]
MPECTHPTVGVGTFVMRGNKFLIGKRKGSHGSGSWQLPGGMKSYTRILEFGESFEDCAKREVLEETNLEITNVIYQTVTNSVMVNENKHYIDIFMRAEVVDVDANPLVMEPNKCECWEWVTWDEFIQGGITGTENIQGDEINKYRPMFHPMEILITTRNGQRPIQTHVPTKTYHPAVLITGTSAGIGRETAFTLAKLGYTVFAGVRKKDDAENLITSFRECDNPNEGRIIPIILDVTNKEHIQNAYDHIQSIIGFEIPFVGLINNAAMVVYLPMEIASEEAFLNSFNTNYFSIVNLTKKFLPLLRRSGGRVINIGSVAAWVNSSVMGIYAATKAAIRVMTRIWRMETKDMDQTISDFRNFNSFPSLSHHYSAPNDTNPKVIPDYEKIFKAVATCSEHFQASPTEIVSDAIVHALTAPYPKNTYYVGIDSRIFALTNWLVGDGIIEAVQSKILSFIASR